MRQYHDAFRTAGASVLAVAQGPPPLLSAFLNENPLPFPLVADPDRKGYAAFGLERTSWGRILRPGSILRYLGLIFRGWLPRRPNAGEDMLQLGGDFVLDSEGRLTFAHRSAEPTDRPALTTLLEAVRMAGGFTAGNAERRERE